MVSLEKNLSYNPNPGGEPPKNSELPAHPFLRQALKAQELSEGLGGTLPVRVDEREDGTVVYTPLSEERPFDSTSSPLKITGNSDPIKIISKELPPGSEEKAGKKKNQKEVSPAVLEKQQRRSHNVSLHTGPLRRGKRGWHENGKYYPPKEKKDK